MRCGSEKMGETSKWQYDFWKWGLTIKLHSGKLSWRLKPVRNVDHFLNEKLIDFHIYLNSWEKNETCWDELEIYPSCPVQSGREGAMDRAPGSYIHMYIIVYVYIHIHIHLHIHILNTYIYIYIHVYIYIYIYICIYKVCVRNSIALWPVFERSL